MSTFAAKPLATKCLLVHFELLTTKRLPGQLIMIQPLDLSDPTFGSTGPPVVGAVP